MELNRGNSKGLSLRRLNRLEKRFCFQLLRSCVLSSRHISMFSREIHRFFVFYSRILLDERVAIKLPMSQLLLHFLFLGPNSAIFRRILTRLHCIPCWTSSPPSVSNYSENGPRYECSPHGNEAKNRDVCDFRHKRPSQEKSFDSKWIRKKNQEKTRKMRKEKLISVALGMLIRYNTNDFNPNNLR